MRRYWLNLLNRFLATINLRIDTLTRERSEQRTLACLAAQGHFERATYGSFRPGLVADLQPLWHMIEAQRGIVAKLRAPEHNDVQYGFDNAYFTSPDAEVLYALLALYRPSSIVEIGSGNSTRVMRQATLDHDLTTKIIAIDPEPRVDVAPYADEVHRLRVEELDAEQIASWLEPNDILFVDSSHVIGTGNDVPFLYFHVLPRLKPGVIVHIHDVFLPYEYPHDWVADFKWGFNEQALLNAILVWSNAFQILWPGYFLQKSDPGFSALFPHWKGRAQSCWLRKRE